MIGQLKIDANRTKKVQSFVRCGLFLSIRNLSSGHFTSFLSLYRQKASTHMTGNREKGPKVLDEV